MGFSEAYRGGSSVRFLFCGAESMWEEWTWYLFHLEAFCGVEFSGA
jgi:hypothetical protein